MMTNEPETTTDITAEPPMPSDIAATSPVEPPALVEPHSPAWLVKADYFLLVLVLVLCFFLSSFTATNSDHWMHLTIGKQISEGTFQFGVDTFSWMTGPVGDQPAVFWVHHSWLYSWLVYQLDATIGGEGLVLLKAILFTLAIALISRVGWTESNRWFILICLAMAAVAMSPRLLMQPIVFSILFLSITVFLLDRASVFAYSEEGARPDVRYLWGLPPLFALWANFDSWFILGPIVLGVCWAASGLANRLQGGASVPAKTLGMVFAVGLVACLANPFHVRVFQLPPELAYVAVTLLNPLGVNLPDAIFAAGKTLRAFHRAEADQTIMLSTWSLSPMAPLYWRNAALGLNAAGLAYVPLLLLGLVSFTLSAYVPAEKKAPTLHMSRFLLWLLLAMLALVLHRMIVFWALLAAPLTAMTLGDFLTWQHKTSAVAFENRRRALQSARLLSVPFMLLLLFMAWPGWLHGSTEFSSARRVAWGARIDVSLVRALESLPEDENPNVFNVSLDLGNATPFAAPKFKHAVDSRLALFSRDASAYLAARASVMDKTKPTEAWQAISSDHGIRHVVLTNFTGEKTNIRLQYLLSANDWRFRFGDNRHLVFTWAGPNQTWPVDTVIADMNRQAFGKVPASQKPVADGPTEPQTPNWLTLYLEGVAGRPTSITETDLFMARYELARESTGRMVQYEGRKNAEMDDVMKFKLKAYFVGLGVLHGAPGSGTILGFSIGLSLHNNTLLQTENGPPALPVLAMRAARRAVAENPRDANGYTALHRANEFLRQNQEENWLGIKGQLGPRHPSRLRNRIRQLTTVTAIHNAVQLEPDHVQYNHLLSVLFEQDHLYDASLKHLQIVESLLPAHLSRINVSGKERDANLREFRDSVARSENNVMQRRAKFKEHEHEKDELKKVQIAINLRYEELRGKGSSESPLGLADKAVELLEEAMKRSDMAPEKRMAFFQIYFDLLLRLGRANAVADWLKVPQNKESLPLEMYAEFRLQSAAAVGDYAGADAALGLMTKGLAEHLIVEREIAARIAAGVIGAPLLSPVLGSTPPSAFMVMDELRHFSALTGQMDRVNLVLNELGNALTLRGILALEAGETEAALVHFERALSTAGPYFNFSDRPIAQRYLDLLKAVR